MLNNSANEFNIFDWLLATPLLVYNRESTKQQHCGSYQDRPVLSYVLLNATY